MISEFTKASLENHLKIYDVNMHGPFVHLQALVPHFIKHKGGQIVGISSLCGRASIAFRSSYNGSKVAFQAFLDTIRSELAPSGIHVCNIMPGYIQTGLSKKAFLSEPGTVYGRVSMNMKKDGMAPDVFAKEALGAIYNQ
jgi:dehydrogenase/reductase SDR family member 7B